jgi:hypothetical protein
VDKSSDINKAIEEKRSELNDLGNKFDLTSPVVIKASKELDVLLNEFHKFSFKRGAVN